MLLLPCDMGSTDLPTTGNFDRTSTDKLTEVPTSICVCFLASPAHGRGYRATYWPKSDLRIRAFFVPIAKGRSMNNHQKPPTTGAGRECPVCGKASYSKNGIHPQCAVIQADMPRQKQLAEDKKRKDSMPKNEKPRQSWTKKCRNCSAEVHVRLKVCKCGSAF